MSRDVVLSRLILCSRLAVLATACATTTSKRVPLHAVTDDQRRAVGWAIAPTLGTSELWRGPGDGCAIALAVQPVPAMTLSKAGQAEPSEVAHCSGRERRDCGSVDCTGSLGAHRP